MRRQVQDKLAVLQAFLTQLDDAATGCAAIAAELGMESDRSGRASSIPEAAESTRGPAATPAGTAIR
jgi:hypothetical protein